MNIVDINSLREFVSFSGSVGGVSEVDYNFGSHGSIAFQEINSERIDVPQK